jgi:hypothetical protein
MPLYSVFRASLSSCHLLGAEGSNVFRVIVKPRVWCVVFCELLAGWRARCLVLGLGFPAEGFQCRGDKAKVEALERVDGWLLLLDFGAGAFVVDATCFRVRWRCWIGWRGARCTGVGAPGVSDGFQLVPDRSLFPLAFCLEAMAWVCLGGTDLLSICFA